MFNTKNRQRQAEESRVSYAFIFDLDGALVEDRGYHLQAWNTLFSEKRIAIHADELKNHVYGTNQEIIRRVAGKRVADSQIAEFSNRKDELFCQLAGSSLRLADGARKFLDDARAIGIPMSLVTSASNTICSFIVDKLYLGAYFKVKVNADDVDRSQPYPDMYLKASLRMGMMPEECIAFENSSNGLEATYRAGMKAFLIHAEPESVNASAQPNLIQVIRDFRSLRPNLAHTYSQLVQLPA